VAAEWIRVSLRAWAAERQVGQQFFETLGIGAGDPLKRHSGSGLGQAALVYLVDEVATSHSSAQEPSEAFAKAVTDGLLKGAAWLDARPPGAFAACRTSGMSVDVFVGAWINQDQLDVDLPAEFLLACGRAGLSVSIVTND
jgi:hypothetical protein